MEKIKRKNENPLIVPKIHRRLVRLLKKKNRGYAFTNKRKPVGSSHFNVVGFNVWNPQAIFTPKRKKLKKWQKNKKA